MGGGERGGNDVDVDEGGREEEGSGEEKEAGGKREHWTKTEGRAARSAAALRLHLVR